MDTLGHGQSSGLPAVRPPRTVRICIWTLEALFVAFIIYLIAGFVLKEQTSDVPQNLTLQKVPQSTLGQADMGQLQTFDPFFRDVAQAVAAGTSRAPESTLRLELFGLRARGDGQGSAIVKMQDGDQKLVQVGDAIAPGILLVGVYSDRLEISRAGAREAVYLRPQAERDAIRTAPAQPKPTQHAGRKAVPADSDLMAGLGALKLEPVRRERRIVGFRLPEDTPFLLTAMGLQAGDILTAANGSPLTSFERIAELSEELKGARRVELTIERRGETRSLTIGL